MAAFGNASYDTFSGGTGSGDVNEAYTVSLAEGLEHAGYAVNADLQAVYTGYLKLVKAGRPPAPVRGFSRYLPIAELDIPADLMSSMAALADVAIVTVGRNAGEGRDRTNTEGDFKLTEGERRLVQQVSSAFQAKGKRAVVVLNTGGSMETASWRDLPDAILLAWQAGQEAGHSIADILSGKVNPSGKLATTFVVDYTDVPSARTFPGMEIPGAPEPEQPPNAPPGFRRPKPSIVTYEDGIYVGYRYYDTFGVKTAYEFGYGLSYTSFDYANLKLERAPLRPQAGGERRRQEHRPRRGPGGGAALPERPSKSLDKPAKELKGFAKTKRLAPGETQTLDFVLEARSLASFAPALSAWVADAGRYEVKLGASSRDIRQTASFELARQLVVKKEARALVPKQSIAELKPPASCAPSGRERAAITPRSTSATGTTRRTRPPRAHLDHFGSHCVRGTPGAGVRRAAGPAGRAREVWSSTPRCSPTSSARASRQTLRPLLTPPVRAGIVGVWTDFKVQYLAYELQTRLGLRDVAVCGALTASREPARAPAGARAHGREPRA